MSRIRKLEAKLQLYVENYDRRLKQLECNHVKAVFSEWNGWSGTYCYYEKCINCGMVLRSLSEQEYLELRLKQDKEKCASERKALETRLAVEKEENE